MTARLEALSVRTSAREEIVDITEQVQRVVSACGARSGMVCVYSPHTTAGITIQENADPEVQHDLERFFARLVPDGDPLFEHRSEGPDDMPAHVRCALTSTQLAVPVADGRLALGTWQGLYVYEHRRRQHTREVVLHLIGD